MSDYAVYFTYKAIPYRLPVNPSEINETTAMGIEKYDVLKLGEISVPESMKLREFTFETEFPHSPLHYIEKPDEFNNADYYLNLFKQVREKKEPILFTAANVTGELTSDDIKDISVYVLIEELEISEKAGEEGDKYVSFKLVEYKDYKARPATPIEKDSVTGKYKKKRATIAKTNPKNTGKHVVQSGDTLWAIAKKYYGDGGKYTKILSANKDKIKNPSLIYPGQKLTIPS